MRTRFLHRVAWWSACALLGCAGIGSREAVPGADAAPALREALEEGEEALTLGELESATTAFERARVLDPRSFDARLGLARVHHAAGRSSEALVILASASGARPERLSRQAAALYCDASEQVVHTFVERARAEVALELARARRASGRCGDAEAVEVFAMAASAEHQLANAPPRQAAAAFVELARIAPERVQAFRRAGALLLSLGPEGRREALEALADGLEAHPDDRPLQWLMLEALGVPAAGSAFGGSDAE